MSSRGLRTVQRAPPAEPAAVPPGTLTGTGQSLDKISRRTAAPDRVFVRKPPAAQSGRAIVVHGNIDQDEWPALFVRPRHMLLHGGNVDGIIAGLGGKGDVDFEIPVTARGQIERSAFAIDDQRPGGIAEKMV